MNSKNGQALRRLLALTAAALTLCTVPLSASAVTEDSARDALALTFLRAKLAGHLRDISQDAPNAATLLALSSNPLLLHAYRTLANRPPAEENAEGTVLEKETDHPAQTEPIAPEEDNGVTPRTIHPENPAGYLVWNGVLISNATDYSLDMTQLMAQRPAAVLTDEMPQVLILHTHGTEAYTMPKGQEYVPSGVTRTEDTRCNVVRIGDEVASVLEEAGISVLHDRTLHDKESYNRSYAHAEKAIAAYLKKYPSIRFVFDIHRDAIQDSTGKVYKVISPVSGRNAAQISLVVGSDGSGLKHDHWRENLKFAVLLQNQVQQHYPTLMRPMYLRNSRYNEHATTGSLLVEIGAAGNSLDEALYAARLFAGELAEVLESLRQK